MGINMTEKDQKFFSAEKRGSLSAVYILLVCVFVYVLQAEHGASTGLILAEKLITDEEQAAISAVITYHSARGGCFEAVEKLANMDAQDYEVAVSAINNTELK